MAFVHLDSVLFSDFKGNVRHEIWYVCIFPGSEPVINFVSKCVSFSQVHVLGVSV